MFVGRVQEMAELQAALASAAGGAGALFLVSGEPGIGKTRLADELTRSAQRDGFRTGWGRSWESGSVPALYLWHQALAGVGLALPDTSAVTALDAEVARLQLFRTLTRSLREASREQPILLVFDDLHAADPSSLLLLHFLARELRSCRAVVVGTYRGVEARLSPGIEALLGQIAREGVELTLGRLERDEVARFVRGSAAGVAPEVEASLYDITQGNPFFLDELLRLLRGQGRSPAGPVPIPASVRETIRRRLERLTPEAAEAFEHAIVLGAELRLATLAAAAALPADQMAARLAEAVSLGLLIEAGANEWAIAHPLVRDVAVRELGAERRAALHRAAADALVRSGRSPAVIAHHYLQAGAASIEPAVEWAVAAAVHALDDLAHENALLMLERAQQAVELVPGASERLTAELLIATGRARIRGGAVAPGQQACRDAAAIAARLGDPALAARAALAYGAQLIVSHVDPELVRMLRDALDSLPVRDAPLRARTLARLAAALQPADDPAEPVALAREAIAMARGFDERTRLDVSVDALAAMMDYVDPAERIALNLEAARLARNVGDRACELRSATRLVFDALELGDPVTADRHIETCERLTRPPRAWLPVMMRAMRAVMDGRFEDGERLVAEALQAAADGADDPDFRRSVALHRLGALRAQGRAADLIGHAAVLRSVLVAVEAHYLPAVLAVLYARAGRTDEVRAHLAQITRWDRARTDANLAALLAEACAAAGDVERAAGLEEVLRAHAGRFFSWGQWGMICEPPLTRQLGLLAGLLGRHEQAVVHLEDALARTEAAGARGYLPWLREELDRARARLEPARPAARPPVASSLTLRKDGEIWEVSHAGGSFRLKDSRGLQILSRLLDHPGEEFHALDLAAPDAPRAEALGDAGEILDRQAVAAYRERMTALQEVLGEAESFGDLHRAERTREELDLLAREVSAAVGLGGRQRRAGSAAERARSAVQRRIRDAIKKIGEHAPELAAHLNWAVRTGTFCAYDPAGRSLPR